MNLEHLKKLIALATKNPNEHEANSAARRVCKMLAEAMEKGELNWNVRVSSKPPNIPYTQSNQSTDEWMGFKRAYNDVRRSPESEFKSRPPNSPPKWENPFKEGRYYSAFDEELLNKIKEEMRNATNVRNYVFYDEVGTPKWEDYEDESKTQQANREKTKKDKRPLNCSKCNKLRETTFVGHPSQFICGDCYWTNF